MNGKKRRKRKRKEEGKENPHVPLAPASGISPAHIDVVDWNIANAVIPFRAPYIGGKSSRWR